MTETVETIPSTGIIADWYSDETATFGDRVAGARETLGIGQVELAKRLGVKLKTLKAWEEDLNEPRANKLQMLSGVLNVSIMWLLTGEGQGVSGPVDASVLPMDVTDILGEIRSLQNQITDTATRLGALEQRLRATLKDQL